MSVLCGQAGVDGGVQGLDGEGWWSHVGTSSSDDNVPRQNEAMEGNGATYNASIGFSSSPTSQSSSF